MSSDEKKKILQMVEEGRITADEAVTLIKAIEEAAAEAPIPAIETGAGSGFSDDAPEFEEVKARARRYTSIPLGIGVVTTILAAYWMFALSQNANYGFWFFCAWFPLLFGILLVTLSASGINSRWLYVDVHQEKGEWPQRITLGFPIPFGLVSWGLRNFGHHAKDLNQMQIDAILSALDDSNTLSEPLIVNVDEGDGGERVQVYIG
ncbi:MAG: hypothetical protein Kow002_19390 [Anaerolineales bacterium]